MVLQPPLLNRRNLRKACQPPRDTPPDNYISMRRALSCRRLVEISSIARPGSVVWSSEPFIPTWCEESIYFANPGKTWNRRRYPLKFKHVFKTNFQMKKLRLPVLKKGFRLLRQHGVPLLIERFARRKAILSSRPVHCDSSSTLEVHMQVCHRDWLNALWTLKSLRAHSDGDFGLFVYLDFNVPAEVRSIFETHFPGIRIPQHEWLDEQVRLRLTPIAPSLAALWRAHHSPTLYKMVNAWICARNPRLLYLDPDVLFFAMPTELLNFVQNGGNEKVLGLFNATKLPPQDLADSGAFSVSEAEVDEIYHLKLPRDFNAGIGVIQRENIDWPFIEEVLGTLRWIPDRTLLLDQTCLALLAARNGWEQLDRRRYLVDEGVFNSSTIAAHYFGSSRRDAFYVEGIPHVRQQGLLQKTGRTEHAAPVAAIKSAT